MNVRSIDPHEWEHLIEHIYHSIAFSNGASPVRMWRQNFAL